MIVLKMILLAVIGWVIIQLSNEAKYIEETKYIPNMQNALSYAEHYITWRYRGDWRELGHRFEREGLYSVDLETDIGTLGILRGGYSEFRLYMRFDSTSEEVNNSHSIRGTYGKETLFIVVFSINEEYVLYKILYKDGKCIPNSEMEQRFAITSDEIMENIEQMYTTFEDEMEKMHKYQIRKVNNRRCNLVNGGFILFIIYMILKWEFVRGGAAGGKKTTEQYLGEIIVNAINKLARWKYVLCGASILFWIYILRPVISGFILFGVERPANVYISYGMSAVIIAIIGCFIIARSGAEKLESTIGQMDTWKTLQMTAGCILEMFIIRLGMVFVSDFYPRSLRFYIINGIAWIGAVFLMLIFRGINYLILKKKEFRYN